MIGVISSAPVVDVRWHVAETLPEYLETDRLSLLRISRAFGGAGWHICSALAGIARVLPLFAVAAGRAGNALVSRLEQLGVPTDSVSRPFGRMRQNPVVEHSDGQRRILCDRSRSAAVPTEPPEIPFTRCSGIVVAGSIDESVLMQILANAHACNVPVAWNPSRSHFDLIGSLAPVTILQLNQTEAAEVTGLGNVAPKGLADGTKRLSGASAVIVTCGPDGACGTTGGVTISVPGPPRTPSAAVGLGDRHLGFASHAFFSTGNLATALRFARKNVVPGRSTRTNGSAASCARVEV